MSEVFANFHFMRPFWLLSGLAIVPVALLVWRQLRSGQAWNAVISESLLPYLLSGSSSRPARWPLAALCARLRRIRAAIRERVQVAILSATVDRPRDMAARYAEDPAPIEAGCDCTTCRHFSRAYVRHLLKANEIFGLRLATLHNLRFMLRTMAEIRQSILEGTFGALKASFLEQYRIVPDEVRAAQRARRHSRRKSSA